MGVGTRCSVYLLYTASFRLWMIYDRYYSFNKKKKKDNDTYVLNYGDEISQLFLFENNKIQQLCLIYLRFRYSMKMRSIDASFSTA